MRAAITTSVINIVINCDFCDKSGLTNCWLCEKDVCLDCSKIWFQDGYDDYPRRLCKNCNILSTPYIKDLELLQENYEISCEDILQKMRECAKLTSKNS